MRGDYEGGSAFTSQGARRVTPSPGTLPRRPTRLLSRLTRAVTSAPLAIGSCDGFVSALPLAVRFPYNAEPECGIGPSALLEPSDTHLDVLICEVKSRGQSLPFNESLRSSVGTMETIIRWAGVFQPEEVVDLSVRLRKALVSTDPPAPVIPTVNGLRNTRVRATLCSPERQSRAPNQALVIDGNTLFTYMRQCA